MQLIEVEAAILIIEEIQQNKDIPKNYGTLLDIKRRIRRLPTIDVEPVVHAHWIYNTDDFTPKNRCSHCGYNKPISAGEGIKQEPDDYCNKCGAKMDEEQE